MKKEYESPMLEIDYLDLSESIMLLSLSQGTDYIPDTDSDDVFD